MVKFFQSLHFVDQRVIVFHTFCVSHFTGRKPQIYYPSYLQTKISASEAHILSSFQIDLTAIFHLK